MIRKNGNIVVDVLSTLGTAWLGQKDQRTFYIKKTITYGSWNIVWDTAPVDDTAWSGGTVQINAYATRTNTIREGFNYRQDTEKEYCTITSAPTLSDCSLSGTSGAAGYTFTWGTYDVTSADREVTLTATHSSGTSSKVIKQTKRDKYVVSIKDVVLLPDVIPASGGSIMSVYYTYTAVYNTGEEKQLDCWVGIPDGVSAPSKGTTPSGVTTVETIPGSTLGTTPPIDGITAPFPNLTIQQAKNDKVSNHDAKQVTTSLELTADPTTVYTNGGAVSLTTVRIYDDYTDSYTWDSGSVTAAVVTLNKRKTLSNPTISVSANAGFSETTISGTSFNIPTYTDDRIFSFKAQYKGASDTVTVYSNTCNVDQKKDQKIEGSDSYENLQVSLSYSNVSDTIPYTFTAAGGTLAMNDSSRATLTVTYTHKWQMVEAGLKSETITKSLDTLASGEYTFNPVTFTASNLSDVETTANNNLKKVAVTVSPTGTGLTKSAEATLTQQANVKSSEPIDGSEQAVRLVATANPKSLSFDGGSVTLSATYNYTIQYSMTSGTSKTESGSKNVSKQAVWSYKSKTGSNAETSSTTLSAGTNTHTVSSIDSTSKDNVVYTYTATYKGISDTDTVTQSPDQEIDNYYENLVITAYNYPTLSGKDYHIANTGGTLNADTWTGKVLTATVDHVIVYQTNGRTVNTENVNIANASVVYDKDNITAQSLGTTEYTSNKSLGIIKATVTIPNGNGGVLSASKNSNTIYQQKNTKTENTGAVSYSNVRITSPSNGDTIGQQGGNVTLKLQYSVIRTYTYGTGKTNTETTNNVDGTASTTWKVNNTTYGTNKTSYTIPALGSTVLTDKDYKFDAEITLGGTKYNDSVTVIQKAKAVSYQKNLVLTIDYPKYTNGVTYHLPARGGTATSVNVTGTYSYIDVYDDNTESAVQTKNINTLSSSEMTFNVSSIVYGSKGINDSDETKVMFNSALTTPQKFTLVVKPTGLKNSTGGQLQSNSAEVAIIQQANIGTIQNQSIVLSASQTSYDYAGGDVALTATYYYSYSYTSGSLSPTTGTHSQTLVKSTTNTSWYYNINSGNDTNAYLETISEYDVAGTRTFKVWVTYNGATSNTVTITQIGRVTISWYSNDTYALWNDGSSGSKTTKVAYGTYLTELVPPGTVSIPYGTNYMYTFNGWFTSASGGNNITSFTQKITSNKSIYAHWADRLEAVIWDANGGIFMSCAETVIYTYYAQGTTALSINDADIYFQATGGVGGPDRGASYSFLGWYTGSYGYTGMYSVTYSAGVPEGGLRFEAGWEEKVLTVSWDRTANGVWVTSGTPDQVLETKVAYGTLYKDAVPPYGVKQEDSNKYGYYELDYWIDKGQTTNNIQSTSTRKINFNLTFTAVFKSGSSNYHPYTKTITFKSNGGSFAGGLTEQSTTVNYGTSFSTLYNSITNPTRNNYTFYGWGTSSTATQPLSGTVVVKSSTISTLYAIWKSNPTVTWNFTSNGGTSWGSFTSNQTTKVEYNATYGTAYNNRPITADPVKPADTTTGTIYKFNGWYTTASGGTKISSTSETKITESRSFYAQFIDAGITLYTVTWHANNTYGKWSDSTTANKTSSVAHGTNINSLEAPANVPDTYDSGQYTYTFNGWYTAASGGTLIANSTSTITSDTHIYAHWTRTTRQLTVKWYKNHGNAKWSSSQSSNTSAEYIETQVAYGIVTKNISTPTKPSNKFQGGEYPFLGWFTAASGGTDISTMNITLTSNVSYYAQWDDANHYDLIVTWNFNTNGDGWYIDLTKEDDNPTTSVAYQTTYGTAYDNRALKDYDPYKTATDTNREYYVFAGWFTSSTGGTMITSASTTKIVTNTTFYAQFTLKTKMYTVNFDPNGGTWPDNSSSVRNVTVEYLQTWADVYDKFGMKYTSSDLSNVTRTGYRSTGWWLNGQSGTSNFFPIPNGNSTTITSTPITFKVVWVGQQTVTWRVSTNGGTWSDTNSSADKTTKVDTSSTYAYAYANRPSATPTKDGYTFKGWSSNSSTFTDISSSSSTITANIIFYAIFEESVTYSPVFLTKS